MNEFFKLEREAKIYKERYPKGTRIELLSMNDSQAVPSGTRGTVNHVDDLGSIHMNWDNGRTLAICPQEDNFRKLTEQEVAEEQLERRSKIVGKSTSLTTDAEIGCFEGYITNNKCDGFECPLFDKENADKICKAYNDEICQMRYDETNDCFVADYPEDGYTEKYECRDYIINGNIEHLYAISGYDWCWSIAEQEEIEDENNAICVEETSDELLESAGPTMSM